MDPQKIVEVAGQAESLGIVGFLVCCIIVLLAVLYFLVRHYVTNYKTLIEEKRKCSERVRRLELAIVDLAASPDIEEVRRKARLIVERLSA